MTDVQIAYLNAAVERLESDPTFKLSPELIRLLREHLDPKPVSGMSVREAEQIFELSRETKPKCGLEIFNGEVQIYTRSNGIGKKSTTDRNKFRITPEISTINQIMVTYFPMSWWIHFIGTDIIIDKKLYYKYVNFYWSVKEKNALNITPPISFTGCRDLCVALSYRLELECQQITPDFIVFGYRGIKFRESFPFNDEIITNDSSTITLTMQTIIKLLDWLYNPFPFPVPVGELKYYKIEQIIRKSDDVEGKIWNYSYWYRNFSFSVTYYSNREPPQILQRWNQRYPKLVTGIESSNSAHIKDELYDHLYCEYQNEFVTMSAELLELYLPECLIKGIIEY